jgi:ABC-type polysaccharide/polyol phosphate transport system ATPase subunit
MNDDVLVRVDNVSKRFCRSLKKSLWYGLQDLGSELGGHRHGGGVGLPQSSADVALRKDEFWAVKDVSFELRRGECLGLIGRNGAGKTTLLKVLNGLIKPDTGRIEMRGRVGALIALGAGFNPVLSGRENIYINASLLGFSSPKTKSLVDEIVEFSGLSEFLDTPVQSYSSGMQVRLGFSIAAHQDPDILILDEVLAVGDKSFRVKCLNKILEIKRRAAVLFVSHAGEQLARVCNKGLLLEKGLSSDGVQPISKALLDYEVSTKHEESLTAVELNYTHEASIKCINEDSKTGNSKHQIELKAFCKNFSDFPLSVHIVIRRGTSLEIACESFLAHVIPEKTLEGKLIRIYYDSINFSTGIYLASLSLTHGAERGVKAYHINGIRFNVENTSSQLNGATSSIINIHSNYSLEPKYSLKELSEHS